MRRMRGRLGCSAWISPAVGRSLGLYLLLFVPFGASLGSAQSSIPREVSVYLAAGDLFRDLSPATVFDEYRCDVRAMRAYGIRIRCQDGMSYTALRIVAENLGVQLVDEAPPCSDDHGARALWLSPVQYDTPGSAWFVVTRACAGPEGDVAEPRYHLVRTRLVDSDWVVEASEVLRGPVGDSSATLRGTV
jgi:hypothetical protein